MWFGLKFTEKYKGLNEKHYAPLPTFQYVYELDSDIHTVFIETARKLKSWENLCP